MRSLLPVLLAVLIALATASALILAYGEVPLSVYRLFLVGTWGSGYSIGQVLFKATPLLFTGLSVAVAFHAGLFNIGAEGQLAAGAFATGLVGAALPTATPAIVALPACIAAGMLAGAAIGAIPGLLKATRGAHEVIVTIMLNWIVLAKLSDIGKHFYLTESLHTARIVDGAQLFRLSQWLPALAGSAANAAFLLASLCALLVGGYLFRTRGGFALRAVGLSPDGAAYAGISVARTQVWAMALAGGIAGMVGSNAVLGYKGYYEEGFSGGVGFMGIAVALLGGNRPLGILLAALAFGTLSQGGLAINQRVPKEMIEVLEGVVILALAAAGATVLRLRGGRS